MTGHSGRRTHISTAINAGEVDHVTVAKGTHHKDVNSLALYLDPSNANKSLASIAVSKASSSMGVDYGAIASSSVDYPVITCYDNYDQPPTTILRSSQANISNKIFCVDEDEDEDEQEYAEFQAFKKWKIAKNKKIGLI